MPVAERFARADSPRRMARSVDLPKALHHCH
jgi:hypothetical protein